VARIIKILNICIMIFCVVASIIYFLSGEFGFVLLNFTLALGNFYCAVMLSN